MNEAKRKGARSIKEIPASIMEQLNAGLLETVNLTEWLAIDQRKLLKNLLSQLERNTYLDSVQNEIDKLKKQTVNTVNETIGTTLFKQAKLAGDAELLNLMASHKSDFVRCWATYTIGRNLDLGLEEMFEKIKPFAADSHFGVREISWLAIRPVIIEKTPESIRILSSWTNNDDENIRRFASEATRPRGVWGEHIISLKQKPEEGLAILEPLKSDRAKYVQNSVANWLNDASKTRPDFVTSLCERWEKESSAKETAYIIKRALRTIHK